MIRAGQTLVFDIGKTHIKVTLVSAKGEFLLSRRAENRSLDAPPYRHFDVDWIWAWLIDQITGLTPHYRIDAISIATHGATSALVDLGTGRLMLPVMDYEFDDYPTPRADYDAIRPDYSETCSPSLPAGLNLGRQLHWQLQLIDPADRGKLCILPYPGYWAWRLSDVPSWEVTSLGCHTDLWNPEQGTFSSLVERLDIKDAFPERRLARSPLGTVCRAVADQTGLPPDCQIWPGLHDSNAGYVPYLTFVGNERPCVISTGTWSIVLADGTPLSKLDPGLDTLANTDLDGCPVATARFMGGREFEQICHATNCDIATHCDLGQIRETIAERSFALPSFAPGTGPFGLETGALIGPARHGKAVAALYCALVLDQMLTRLGVDRPIVIEGSFAGNVLLCGLIATLRQGQPVFAAEASGGVVNGCWRVTLDHDLGEPPAMRRIDPLPLPELVPYRHDWLAHIHDRERSQCRP